MDAESGDIHYSLPAHQRDAVMAGAVLLDLALENRIDMDPTRLFVTDSTPLGDDLVDPILAAISSESSEHDTAYWLELTAKQGDEIRERTLERLVQQGIVEEQTNGTLVLTAKVNRTQRYQSEDGTTVENVQSRVMSTLYSDEIPDSRDTVIIGLAGASGVFESMLIRDEYEEVRDRIEALSQLDLMGQTIRECIRNIEPPEPPKAVIRPPEDIPVVPGLPVLGNAIGMAGDVRVFLAQCYRTYGPIFRVSALSHRFIVMVGPEANAFLTKISGTHIRSHEPYQDFGLAAGAHRVMLNMDGPEHLRMRKLLVNGYSPKTFEANLDAIHKSTQRMIAEWPEDQPLEVQYAMQKIIAEQIGQCCTSVSPGEYIDDLIRLLETMVSVHITQRWPATMKKLPPFRRAKQRLQVLFNQIVTLHNDERESEHRDLVDAVLEMNRNEPQFMPETDLFANILSPYLVGIDTSATVCAFMLYALLTQPELLAQMKEEVDEMFDEGPPTPKALGNLDITHRVAMETLRIYPVVPAIPRIVSNSFEFGGYRVPAGEQLLIGSTVSHHLEECFPDPARFDIERHTKEARKDRPQGAFAPFGLGRHRCIGSGFSEVQIALTLATIVREANIELEDPDRPLKIKLVPAPHPDASLRMVVKNPQRSSASA